MGMKDARRTEQRLAASKKLDRMTALEIVRLMNREDRRVAAAVRRSCRRLRGLWMRLLRRCARAGG